MSALPSLIILGLIALIALALTYKNSAPSNPVQLKAASTALFIATIVQSIHCTEETVSGFPAKFPALFGLPAIPQSFFIGFNVMWIAIWLIAVPALRAGKPPAMFAAWFLAIAGIANGIAHPLLAIAAGGYFPGLLTSPFIGLAGIWLGRRLHRAA